MEEILKINLGNIKENIRAKYQLPELTEGGIKREQKKLRLNNIRRKRLHGKLFSNDPSQPIDTKSSSTRLQKGNISPQEEGVLCKLQDRNLFFQKQKCNHCKLTNKGVDHLATCCGRLLNSEYKKRHNEIVRSIHFLFAKRYGLNARKKLKNYKVESVLSNDRVKIKSDVPILTDIHIEHNKPDLLIHDLKLNEITLVEVGVTNVDRLKETETEKSRKCELLGRELEMIHRAKVVQIPVVMTWDGLTTYHHRRHLAKLGIDGGIQAYLQTTCLKSTAEIVLTGSREAAYEDTLETLMEGFESF